MQIMICRRLLVLAVFAVLPLACRPSTPDATSSNAAPATTSDGPLRVIVIDDPALGEVMAREWQAHAQQPVELTALTTQALPTTPVPADVVVFPSQLLGQMVVDRWIVPLPDQGHVADAEGTVDDAEASADFIRDTPVATAADAYDWEDVLPWLRRRELRWGHQLYGVSFGSPQLMLAYRQDWFDRWHLSPPKTWSEYQALLMELQGNLDRDVNTAAMPPERKVFATSEPIGRPWVARLLLARAAAYARHPNQYSALFQFSTMTPWIDQPPFVRALQELLATQSFQRVDEPADSPEATMQRLLRGECAMALTWPSAAHSSRDASDAASNADLHLALSPLPGSTDVYSVAESRWQPRPSGVAESIPLLGAAGRIGAVSRHARSRETAANFLLWLTRKDDALRLTTKSPATTLARQSQTPKAQDWLNPALVPQSRQFVDILLANQQQPLSLTLLRLPGQQQYLSSLEAGILAAWADPSSAEAALRNVADRWLEITRSLDVSVQQRAYIDSLGLDLN